VPPVRGEDIAAGNGREHANGQSSSEPDGTIGPGAREAALSGEPSLPRRFLKMLGPGIISGASDDDPASIGTCAQLGASLGFATLWTMLVTVPLMAALQYVSAKIGLVTGNGLAGVIRQHYPRWLLFPLLIALLIANIINAGADLGAVAAAVNLLVPRISATALVVPIAGLIIALQVWGNYRLIERIFKWLTLSLFGYVGAAFLSRADLREVLWNTFVPTARFDAGYLQALVAVSGTTFSPYLYFWQASLEVEQKVAQGRRHIWQRRGTTDAELKYAAWDVNIGMVLSNIVTYCIILTAGARLFPNPHIENAAQAAEALEPLAGPAAKVLLALGLIGTGLLTVPVLTTSAAYALAEAFRWKRGLDRHPTGAWRFYLIITLATFAAVEMNFLGINVFSALFWTSVIYGFLAPPLLILLMLISGNREIMGERVNGPWTTILGWICVAVTFLAAAGLIASWCC
jgi:NRAMP (natural resistance-associated macrophage protein)-like metal ion transporter